MSCWRKPEQRELPTELPPHTPHTLTHSSLSLSLSLSLPISLSTASRYVAPRLAHEKGLRKDGNRSGVVTLLFLPGKQNHFCLFQDSACPNLKNLTCNGKKMHNALNPPMRAQLNDAQFFCSIQKETKCSLFLAERGRIGETYCAPNASAIYRHIVSVAFVRWHRPQLILYHLKSMMHTYP